MLQNVVVRLDGVLQCVDERQTELALVQILAEPLLVGILWVTQSVPPAFLRKISKGTRTLELTSRDVRFM